MAILLDHNHASSFRGSPARRGASTPGSRSSGTKSWPVSLPARVERLWTAFPCTIASSMPSNSRAQRFGDLHAGGVCPDAIFEAIEAGIGLIVCLTEGLPSRR